MLKSSWEVFMLFLVRVGGGIPAGVILANSRGLPWPLMIVLYFFSDVVLACVFDPLMRFFAFIGRKNQGFQRYIDAMHMTVHKTTARYGMNPGPLTLILISFG